MCLGPDNMVVVPSLFTGKIWFVQYDDGETTTTTEDADTAEEDDDGLADGTIAVIVIGILFTIVVVTCLIYLVCEQRKSLVGNGSVGRQGSNTKHIAVNSNLSTDSAGFSTGDAKL